MVPAGDVMSACESGGAGRKFCKSLFRPEINEDPQNVSHEAGPNNSTGASELSTREGGNFASISLTVGKPELEQILKQMTFTRSETQRLIALLHSRTMEESPSPVLRLEASSTTTGLLKRHKHGDERDSFQFHASVVSSRVVEEEIASPAELANAYKGSTIGTSQSPRQDSKLINSNATRLSKTSVASQQHPTTMENLPEELLLNIFIRLLAKQLAQMRSVSKSWNALLSQSTFVKSHLDRSVQNNDQVLLVFCDEKESKIFTTHSCRSPHLELTNFIKLPVNLKSEYTSIRVIGCVNGLICFSNSDSVIHIWNPSLSAVSTLPQYSMPSVGYDSLLTFFRFGFDPKTDDYKIVKLTGLTGPPTNVVRWWLDVEIYSMRKGTWKLITERFPSHITDIVDDDGVCVDGHDGHLHWLAHYFIEERYSDTIVAFDLGSETFSEIPLPHSILDYYDSVNVIGVLAGKLCVISNVFVDKPCEVWVMDEYGVAESWVKHHVFSRFTFDTYPYGFISYNELLFEDDGSLALYDPIANKEKVFENYCPEFNRPQKIVKHVDSLVWIAPVERQMGDGAGQIDLERYQV